MNKVYHLCTKKEARLILGIVLFSIFDYFILSNINLNTIVTLGVSFMMCFQLVISIWFSQQAPEELFSIDFRSEHQIEEEKRDNLLSLVKAKENELHLRRIDNRITEEEFKQTNIKIKEFTEHLLHDDNSFLKLN